MQLFFEPSGIVETDNALVIRVRPLSAYGNAPLHMSRYGWPGLSDIGFLNDSYFIVKLEN